MPAASRSRSVILSCAALLIVSVVMLIPSPAADAVPPLCDGKLATLVGTPGDDVLKGTKGDDVIVGLGGDDRLVGRGGADTICGSEGDDTLIGAQAATRSSVTTGPIGSASVRPHTASQ